MSYPVLSAKALSTRIGSFPLLAWLCLLGVGATQVAIGIRVLPGDLTGADPPAHYVTGVMVYDFLHSGSTAPLKFAQCF